MGAADQLAGCNLAEARAFHRPGRETDAPHPRRRRRWRRAQKYGDDAVHVSLAYAEGIAHGKSTDLVALDDALNELVKFEELLSMIVELRFFGGLSLEETAAALKISTRTVQREWSLVGVALP